MEKEIGSLEVGKKADLITVRTRRANAMPLFNPVSQMVYSLKAGDVSDVIINGRIVVRARRVITLDANAILTQAELWGAKISKR